MRIANRIFKGSGFVQIILGLLFCTIVTSSKPILKDKDVLLIYVVLKDSSKISLDDTSWVNRNICFSIIIDTIPSSAVMEFKKDKDHVYFNGNLFNKSQFRDLSKVQELKSYKVESYQVVSTFISSIIQPTYWGECLSKDAKKSLRYHYSEFYKRGNIKTGKIWIAFIKAKNQAGKEITLNDILFELEK